MEDSMEIAGFIAWLTGIVIVLLFVIDLFSPGAKNSTTTTWKITRKGGKVMYHTTNEDPTHNWDDVVSVEEVKL